MRLNLKPPRVFYGWWIVGASFLLALYVGGVVFYGFTAVFEPIANEFGWSYAQISLAASLRGMETGLLAPLMGMLVDRWGPRRLIFSGATLTCLGLILLSRTNSLGMFYGAFAIIAIGVSAFSITILVTAVANWFRQKLSLAIGITSCGYGFSGLLIPVVVKLIDMYEWRTAMVICGLGFCLIGLPLSLLMRHKPEQYGYLPDGEVSSSGSPVKNITSVPTAEEEGGIRQAITSRAFWHIGIASLFQSTILFSIITHVMPYLSSVGIARTTAGLVASGVPVLSTIGRLGFGWFGDRINKRLIIAVGFAMLSFGVLSFSYVNTEIMWLLVPFLLLFSIGYGGNNIIRMALVREYFGRSRFGSIHGFIMGVMTLGHISGPPLAGWVFDNWGSYRGIWVAFAGLAVGALIIMATLPPASSKTRFVNEG